MHTNITHCTVCNVFFFSFYILSRETADFCPGAFNDGSPLLIKLYNICSGKITFKYLALAEQLNGVGGRGGSLTLYSLVGIGGNSATFVFSLSSTTPTVVGVLCSLYTYQLCI